MPCTAPVANALHLALTSRAEGSNDTRSMDTRRLNQTLDSILIRQHSSIVVHSLRSHSIDSLREPYGNTQTVSTLTSTLERLRKRRYLSRSPVGNLCLQFHAWQTNAHNLLDGVMPIHISSRLHGHITKVVNVLSCSTWSTDSVRMSGCSNQLVVH